MILLLHWIFTPTVAPQSSRVSLVFNVPLAINHRSDDKDLVPSIAPTSLFMFKRLEGRHPSFGPAPCLLTWLDDCNNMVKSKIFDGV